MNRKLSIIELAELVAAKAQTTNRMSELFLKELFATVSQELSEGRGVEIKGLGSFVIPTAMTADEEVSIEFAPAKLMAETINQPFAQFEPVELSDDLTPEQLQQLMGDDEDLPETEEPQEIEKPQETEAPQETPETQVTQEIPATPESSVTPEIPKSLVGSDSPESPVITETPETLETPVPPETPESPESSETPETSKLSESEKNAPVDYETEKRKVAKTSLLKGIVVGALGALVLTSLLWILFGPRGVISGTGDKTDTAVVATASTASEKSASNAINETNKPQVQPVKKEIPVIRDTVSAKRPLRVIARKHYGNEFFYVYIYEENKDRIKDVNNIAPGTEVIIPLASKYGFDPKDPESIKQAQIKSIELCKKH